LKKINKKLNNSSVDGNASERGSDDVLDGVDVNFEQGKGFEEIKQKPENPA